MSQKFLRRAALLLALASAFTMGVVSPGAPAPEMPAIETPAPGLPIPDMPTFDIPDIPMFDTPMFEVPVIEDPLYGYLPPISPDPLKADARIAPSAHMSFEELVGDDKERGSPPKDFPDKDTYKVVIDKGNKVMTVYDREDDTIVRQMLCTIGKAETPSPRGTFKMGKHRVRFGRFVDFDCCAQYWTEITRNVYIHSVLYREKNAKTLIRQSYRELGKAASHGCIRLTVPDAKWIYENIAPGTKCEFIKAEKDEALRESLRLAPLPKKK